MTRLTLSLSCVDYDRTRAIRGEGYGGCDIVPTAMSPEEAFHRAFKFQEFDITELSMSSYMNEVAKDGSPYVGIPAFLSRMFRHSSIYIRTDKGIEKPEDLKSKVVGVPEYQMTAALWVRGMLADEYGVQPADMSWRDGGLEEGGKIPNVNLKLPEGVHLETIPTDRTCRRCWIQGDRRPDECPSALLLLPKRERNTTVSRLSGSRRRPITRKPAFSRSCISSASARAWSNSTHGCR